jgi:hypothetical protein
VVAQAGPEFAHRGQAAGGLGQAGDLGPVLEYELAVPRSLPEDREGEVVIGRREQLYGAHGFPELGLRLVEPPSV